ncbi:MAG: amino-acid N-acetyltransferase, partial [Myxococcales bacterium]|nr:amino-acid N-acetyltransferase [Myxococcales bacterium]
GCAKEAVGTARVELEALLSMGQPSSPMGGARLRVAAGNFVTARPMGVIDGVDLMHTGAVRRVDAEAIRQRLDAGSIVVLGSIGYSITGEAFNVSTHEVAAATAIALGADKLVCLFEGRGLRRAGDRLGDLDLAETRALLGSRRKLSEDQRRSLEAAVDACEGGVGRVHLLPRRLDGGLLTELFTREGAGTLITRESFEDIRQATQRDVPGLLRLIEPLAERGVLVRRPREMLEMEFDRFFVVERDGLVVACAALYAFPAERKAELACLAVHDRYREAGRGEALLGFLERRARQQKFEHLFVLTTQTDHWFIERGFERVSARALPRARRQQLDPRRRSKVLEKRLLG